MTLDTIHIAEMALSDGIIKSRVGFELCYDLSTTVAVIGTSFTVVSKDQDQNDPDLCSSGTMVWAAPLSGLLWG